MTTEHAQKRYHLSPFSIRRRREKEQSTWQHIMTECENERNVMTVALRYPHLSYRTISRRFQHYKRAKNSPTHTLNPALRDHRGEHCTSMTQEEEIEFANHLRSHLECHTAVFNKSTIRTEALLFYNLRHPHNT